MKITHYTSLLVQHYKRPDPCIFTLLKNYTNNSVRVHIDIENSSILVNYIKFKI